MKKRFNVKVKPLKLQGLCNEQDEDKSILVQMKWTQPKPGFVPFYRSSSKRYIRSYSQSKSKSIQLGDDEEFEISSKDGSLVPGTVCFDILLGEMGKLVCKGKACLNLAGVVTRNVESIVEQKLQIISSKAHGGGAIDATLLVRVSIVEEVRSLDESVGPVQKSERGDAFYKIVTGLKGGYKKKQKNGVNQQKCGQEDDQETPSSSSIGSDESTTFDSSDGSPPPANRKDGFFNSWKKRSFSFRSSKWKIEPLVPDKNVKEAINWKTKDFASRDGQTKLKTKVFLASFDQRSEKAAGESACTALVTVIADWLHSNEDTMPKPFEFDSLITEGSSEWRKLCENVTYTNKFPDKHFDLETVLEAGIKPIMILPEKSFTGFFSPEMFHALKDTMSFDEIWDEIANQTDYYGRPRVYIVSWNDHFFVLKVEPKAYYIIDSLGERLYEGCNQAYILKFDESSSMYEKTAKDQIEPVQQTNKEAALSNPVCSEEMVCRGKECCKEYIKRFLAAIPVMELEAEERKGRACAFSLHKRLQIDFHYSCSFVTSSSTTGSLD